MLLQRQHLDDKTIRCRCRFTFSDGAVKEFDLRFDAQTLALRAKRKSAYPAWTRLSYKKCPQCPLKRRRRCPVAANLVDVVMTLKDRNSAEKVDIEVVNRAGSLKNRTGLSRGFSSLVKTILTTSGCPILDRLRPMAFSQTLFGDVIQTAYGLFAMHMLAQHFRFRQGRNVDWKMMSLPALIDDVGEIVDSLVDRIQSICTNDANFNALLSLSCVVGIAKMLLERGDFAEIKGIFSAHFTGEEPAHTRRCGVRRHGSRRLTVRYNGRIEH